MNRAAVSVGLNSLASHQKVQDDLDQSDGSPAYVVTARHGTWQLLSAKTQIILKTNYAKFVWVLGEIFCFRRTSHLFPWS
jgi:hypothetical protein